jgi:hypothetical protein
VSLLEARFPVRLRRAATASISSAKCGPPSGDWKDKNVTGKQAVDKCSARLDAALGDVIVCLADGGKRCGNPLKRLTQSYAPLQSQPAPKMRIFIQAFYDVRLGTAGSSSA